jgi:hypothetical protein
MAMADGPLQVAEVDIYERHVGEVETRGAASSCSRS